MELTESRQKALECAINDYAYMSGNLLYQSWRQSAIQSFNFYDGTGQYDPSILQILHERGQAPIVVNKVRSMVNQASGMEINTRGKIAFKPHSYSEEEEKLTTAMTHYGFAVQNKQHYSFKGSLSRRDALICGLGWSHTELYNRQILYHYIHPLNVIFDADDLSPQLDNMQKLILMNWYSPEQLKAEYPQFAKRIDDFSNKTPINAGNFTPEFFSRQTAFLPTSGNGTINGSRILVNQVFKKEKKKYYWGFDKAGYYFETFDEEFAEKIANKKSEIEVETGTQIVRTVFCNDLLLHYAPLSPNLPNAKDFPVIPCVWLRRTADGVPIGWLEDIKDLQKELNYRKLKEVSSLNSRMAIVDHDAFDSMSAEEIRQELSRNDGVIFKSGKGNIEIIPNTELTNSMIKAAERIDHEFQQVSGMYSDSMGDATNATSGVAIRQRQIGTSKNLAFGFDAFTHVKEREGQVLLDLMQGSALENIMVDIVLDDDERESFIMNLVRESDGHIFNDIRTIPVDIFIEIVPDYDSSSDEQRELLRELLSNPQAPLIMQNPFLLKMYLGGRNSDKIASAMQQLNQQQNMQQAMARGNIPSQGGMGMPPDAMNPIQLGSEIGAIQ